MKLIITDRWGEEVEIRTGIYTHDSSRVVLVGDYMFTPDDARRLAAALVDAAHAAENGLVALSGGAA